MSEPPRGDGRELARIEDVALRLRGIADDLLGDPERRGDGPPPPDSDRRVTPQPSLSQTGQRRPLPNLPDPRRLEKILRQRRLRDRYFGTGLFADPAWDILLELGAAHARHRQVCVSSLCIAAAVPQTTALRWINLMIDKGLLERRADPIDKRRVYILLTDDVARSLARYFDEIDNTML